MSRHQNKSHARPPFRPSRREVLGAAALFAAGGWKLRDAHARQTVQPQTDPPPWWLTKYGPRSRVVDIRSNDVLENTLADPVPLGEMLDQGIRKLTQAPTAEKGWQSILGSARRIVLKFNNVGSGVLNTNGALAGVLVQRLGSAGYDPELIALLEATMNTASPPKTREPSRGWGDSIPVGGQQEQLARYLLEADAIVNVPLLKTHQIAGMSCCLKNISHAVIRHPAAYHANGCSPFVAQVIANEKVSSKLKLNLVNAIRIVVDRGPDALEEHVVGYGGLLLGFDPVAVDHVGLGVLAIERRRRGLTRAVNVRYLAAAARANLGRWRPEEIERLAVDATV